MVWRKFRLGTADWLVIESPELGEVRRIPQAWTDQAISEPGALGARFTPMQLRTARRWLDIRSGLALDKPAAQTPLEGELEPPPLAAVYDSYVVLVC
jgi:hypothetical protein